MNKQTPVLKIEKSFVKSFPRILIVYKIWSW